LAGEKILSMNPTIVGAVVFAGAFGGGLLGLRIRAALPEQHLGAETKDVVKLAMGLVATLTALTLGLLIASAKGSYDAQRSGVIQLAAKIAFLDRTLAIYGPDSAEARTLLRHSVEVALARMWPDEKNQPAQLDPSAAQESVLYHAIQRLSPADEEHRALKSQAVQIVTDLGQMRWLLFEQAASAISTPVLIVVSVWLAVIFASFGVFAPRNSTVVTALLVASLSVAGSIFLLLELDQPFDGAIQIPSTVMRRALDHLGH
jgi:hypothetical protein